MSAPTAGSSLNACPFRPSGSTSEARSRGWSCRCWSARSWQSRRDRGSWLAADLAKLQELERETRSYETRQVARCHQSNRHHHASARQQTARRDEKAHGRLGGPFHTASDRKIRENADAARDPETDGKPCKAARLRDSRTRLKIVVSPVRVRVSPFRGAVIPYGSQILYLWVEWRASWCRRYTKRS